MVLLHYPSQEAPDTAGRVGFTIDEWVQAIERPPGWRKPERILSPFQVVHMCSRHVAHGAIERLRQRKVFSVACVPGHLRHPVWDGGGRPHGSSRWWVDS